MLGPEQEEAAGMVALCLSRREVYAVAAKHTLGARLLVRETGLAEAPKPRLLERAREEHQAGHVSYLIRTIHELLRHQDVSTT